MKTRREFMKVVGQGAAGGLLLRAIPLGLGRSLLWRGVPVGLGAAGLSLAVPRRADAAVVLDPVNPTANFAVETAKSPPSAIITPGPVLRVNDPAADDLITLYASEPDIAAGIALDLVVNFLIQPGNTREGADTGVRFVINDGTKAIYACCIVKNLVKGIALASGTDFASEGNYLASSFVPVDWNSPNPPTADGRVTLRFRRTALGTAQIVEVNGVVPDPRVEILSMDLPAPQRPRATPTVEFGCSSLAPSAILEIASFRVERVGVPFASFAARTEIEQGPPGANKDEFEVKGIFTLGDGSDGIDIPVEIVSLELSGGAGGFSTTIPAGFFRQDKKGRFKFETIIDVGVFEAVIRPLGGNTFEFKAEGGGFNLGAIANPVNVSLTIGDDGGTTEVLAEIEP